VSPVPVLPNYVGGNIRGIVPALLAPRRVAKPVWIPEPARSADQVVLLVVDGLGWDQLRDHEAIAPTLAAMAGHPITSVAPTTTATALTSITTGLTPGEHGIVGYRMEIAGDSMNVLRWWTGSGDARRVHEPGRVQPFAPFMGEDVPVVNREELERSAFTESHMRGGRPFGYRTPSGLPVLVGQLLRNGERLVYAYYDGLDKIAHQRGFGPFYEAELAQVDALVAQTIAQLPAGAALLVTADHGQVHVGPDTRAPHPDVQRLTRSASGEGRFRWLHAKPGAASDLLAAALDHHRDVAWVVSREEAIAAGWFGPVVSPPVAARYGDVALVPFAPISFDDPVDGSGHRLVCRHGSLTSAEMLVPLLAAAGG
jgi:hypothetical protein